MYSLFLQIKNSDDVVVGVPNSQLTGQRVYNLSRTPQSQVKQTLRISYEDASKIPLLVETIKEEIRKDCDKLIPDRLRCHWANFEDDHLEVVVDAHFAIKPTGVEYHDNRQKVLQAIYRAVKKTGVNFESRIRR
jgi:small-conductance mechanosensitive channel